MTARSSWLLGGETQRDNLPERPWFETPQAERWPEFSPDGHWLAYASDVSGRFEVYVRVSVADWRLPTAD